MLLKGLHDLQQLVVRALVDRLQVGQRHRVADTRDDVLARVRELINDGVQSGALRAIDGTFAGQLTALAIEGIQSGVLLDNTGLTAGQAYNEMAARSVGTPRLTTR